MNPFRRHIAAALLALGLICGANAADQTYTIAVIPKGTTHEFWKSIHAGAVKAQEELAAQGIKVELMWKGPVAENGPEQQNQGGENFKPPRVRRHCLGPPGSQALVKPVASAAQAKVPVVIIDS